MSATTTQERQPQATPVIRRQERLAWLAVGGSFVLFCVLCAGVFAAGFWYAGHAPETHTASLELGHGSTVDVNRSGTTSLVVPSFTGSCVIGTARNCETLSEGDTVHTGPDTDALVTLFDNSTVQLNYDTTIKLQRLRSSRFFNQFKDILITLERGSILVATSDPSSYGANPIEVISQPGAHIQIFENSTTLVTLNDSASGCGAVTAPCIQAIARKGRTHVIAEDTRDIESQNENANMLRIGADGALLGPQRAEEDLITNGDFVVEPGESTVDLAAGWRRRPWSGPNHGAADRTSESVPGQSAPLWAAHFVRRTDPATGEVFQDTDQVGIVQDINRQVSIYNSLELTMTVKIAEQSPLLPEGANQVYPLTVRLVYEDTEGGIQTWSRSFYYIPPVGTPVPSAVGVRPAVWAPPPEPFYLLNELDQVSVVKSIEIDASGSTYDVWVTDIRLIGR